MSRGNRHEEVAAVPFLSQGTCGSRRPSHIFMKQQPPLLLAVLLLSAFAGEANAQAMTAPATGWSELVNHAVHTTVSGSARIDLAPLRAPMGVDSVTHYAGLNNRGIYGWYADGRARAALRQAGLSVRDDGLVYIGKTKVSFQQRVLGKHIRGSETNSTLRRTLKGVLIATDSTATPAEISRFMRAHLKVAMLSIDDAALIDSVEDTLIKEYKPALNVKGNPNSARVKELRKLEDVVPRRPRVRSVATNVASARVAVATIAKGTGLAGLVEAPVTLTVEALHVVNRRKTVEAAAWDATQTLGLAGLAGGAAAGAMTAATGLGLTISAPVVVPLAVVGGGAYVWVSGERVWGALDEETREAAEARLASVRNEIEERAQPIRDRAVAVFGAAQGHVETAFTALGWRGSEAVDDQS